MPRKKPELIFFHTGNGHKLNEASQAMSKLQIKIRSLRDISPSISVVEPQGEDCAHVARSKIMQVLHLVEHKLNGNWLMVEDSGLFVDALGGFPGVYSSYVHSTVGIEGIVKLLEVKEDTSASYISSIAFWDGERIHSVQGHCKGRISPESRGDGGFGYDPIFIPEAGDDRTFSEMNLREKTSLSHRTMALKKMVEKLNFPSI